LIDWGIALDCREFALTDRELAQSRSVARWPGRPFEYLVSFGVATTAEDAGNCFHYSAMVLKPATPMLVGKRLASARLQQPLSARFTASLSRSDVASSFPS
jgi:hypothetical protein